MTPPPPAPRETDLTATASSDTATLQQLVSRLEEIAGRLRSGDLETEAAAQLVDECAHVASGASAELERLARMAASEPLPGQDQLL